MNLLFVSIAFPPKNDPECIQTARYFKYLSRDTTLSMEVVTSAIPTMFMPYDESLNPLDRGYTSKVQIPVYESRLTNKLLRKIGLGRIFFPDSKMTFHWQWQRVVKAIQHKPDVIYSRSNPVSSAFMALKLKKYFGVPWVLHFSDPWALSPLENVDPKKIQTEKELISEATRVTFTTEETVSLYARNYPESAHKFSCLPNVFDPEDLRTPVSLEGERLNVVYTGGLAGERSMFFFKDVLQEIERIDETLLKKLNIEVAGPMDRHNASFFSANQYACIRHLGELSYDQARQIQNKAHLLLVVDNPTNCSGAIFFPSKLLDYFVAGKMILACTPEGSTTRRILKDYPSACFQASETKAIAAFLIDQIRVHVAGRNKNFSSPPPLKYSAEENAKKLSLLFTEALQSA